MDNQKGSGYAINRKFRILNQVVISFRMERSPVIYLYDWNRKRKYFVQRLKRRRHSKIPCGKMTGHILSIFFIFPLFHLLNYFTFICNYSYHAHSLSLSLSVHFCQFWFYFVAKKTLLTKNIHLEFSSLVPAFLKYTSIHPFPFMLYLSREWREINCKEKEGGAAW